MEIKAYEKKIAYLEDLLRDTKNSLEDMNQRRHLELAVSAKREMEFFQGLMKFMSGLYSQLAKIQNELLENMSKANKILGRTTEEKASLQLKALGFAEQDKDLEEVD